MIDLFAIFLNGISPDSLCVLDKNIPLSKYVPIDLSSSNPLLDHFDRSSSKSLEKFINQQIEFQNGNIGYGGYNETRSIYKRSSHFNKSNLDNERNIHLGIDLWSHLGTPIYAPLKGKVHSFNNNTNYGDYGPTIILKHQINKIVFYTLYGHLNIQTINNLTVNQVFEQGEKLAELGDSTVNGDYPPHLHFQIIKDIQGYNGDYPGVCNKRDLTFYLNNCPDPNLLLKLAHY